MNIIERILESVAREIKNELVVRGLELYFVVRPVSRGDWPAPEDYELMGMTYSQQAAKKLWLEHRRSGPCNILRIDLGKLLPLIERLGAIEKIV